MSSPVLDALARTAARRFQSFAEAATSVLDLVHAAAPGERVALAQIDWEEGTCRVIDARGDDGELRGMVVPLSARFPSAGAIDPGELLDPQALASLGFAHSAAAPLDASDGSTVGVLLATGAARTWPCCPWPPACSATSGRASPPAPSCAAWARSRATASAPTPSPASPTAASLLAALEREWELGRRGTVLSFLVVCRIAGRDALRARAGDAAADLLLKDVAEVFAGGIRRTDLLGARRRRPAGRRAGGLQGGGRRARFRRPLRARPGRRDRGRPAPIELAYGFCALADAPSGRGLPWRVGARGRARRADLHTESACAIEPRRACLAEPRAEAPAASQAPRKPRKLAPAAPSSRRPDPPVARRRRAPLPVRPDRRARLRRRRDRRRRRGGRPAPRHDGREGSARARRPQRGPAGPRAGRALRPRSHRPDGVRDRPLRGRPAPGGSRAPLPRRAGGLQRATAR